MAYDPMGLSDQIVTQAQGAGYFNPLGSPILRELRRRAALRIGTNQRRRAAGAAQLYGLDPSQARAAAFAGARDAAGQQADLLNQGALQEQQGNLDFARSQLSGGLDYARQRALEKYRADLARKAQGGIGGTIGRIVGTGVGAFTGGYGTALGGG